jgi:imidazolonepropionase-like amidohydrolase
MTTRLLTFAMLLLTALPAAAEEVVIKAAKVYTVTGPPLTPGMVRVKDGKVAEVAATITAPAGAQVIDLGPGCLIPGLIDAHTSIGLDGDNEYTAEVTPNFRVLDAVDWSARAFRTALSEGTTTVSLVPGTENVIAGLSSVVKTGGDPAQRVLKKDNALVIAMSADPAARNSARNRPDSIYNRQPTNRMGVVWILRAELARAKSSTTRDTAVIREALEGKRPVVCVSRIDADILSALRLRQEHPIPQLMFAGAQEAYKVTGDLAAAKTPVLLGPLLSTAANGPEATETVWNLPGTLHGTGIPFTLTGGRLLEQARFAVRYGLAPEAALAAVTSTPAKLLGIEGRVGAIAVGRDADLVALTGDPFDLTAAIRWTMTDGLIRSGER